MHLDLNLVALRVLPVALCAAFAATDAVGQASADSATKSMKAPPSAPDAAQPIARGVRIGVMINPLNEALAAQLGLEASKGILVEEVVDDGPAAKAGLLRYDVIVAMNDEPVSSEKGLRDHLAGLKPGDTVSIKVVRKGETLLIPVVVEARPADAYTVTTSPDGAMQVAPAESDELREWVEKQRAWAGEAAKQQAEWSKQLAEQSRAFVEQLRQEHQAEIERYTTELLGQVDAWKKQAAELNTPENRAKFEASMRDYVNRLVDQVRAGADAVRMPAIRYYTTQDGTNQAVVESQVAGDAGVNARLDAIEQRMERIEQMLEKIAAK